MRLFLAIFPPKNVLDQLRDTQRLFNKDKRNLKFIAVDQLHVSVKFFGADVSDYSKDLILAELKNLQDTFGPIQVNIGKTQMGFAKETFPQVLNVKVENSNSLDSLSESVHQILKILQLRDTVRWKDKTNETFHITLARLKKTSNLSAAKSIKERMKSIQFHQIDNFETNEMFLIQSYFENGVSKYRKLERIKL